MSSFSWLSPFSLLKALLAYPPATMHLVVTTRRDPPLPLMKLRDISKMTEIRMANLRFSADETGTFLQRVMQIIPVDHTTCLIIFVAGIKDQKLR